jgi:hypothetical protein
VIGVTADTNIYISALNFDGAPDKVLDLARAGDINLLFLITSWTRSSIPYFPVVDS